MEIRDIKFIKILRPIKKDVDKAKGQDFLKVVFEYEGKKFVIQYEQPHNFYDGMPGRSRGFYDLTVKVGEGSYKTLHHIGDGLGEFNVPIPEFAPNGRRYSVDAHNPYGTESYRCEALLDISEEDIFEMLIKPYFELYF